KGRIVPLNHVWIVNINRLVNFFLAVLLKGHTMHRLSLVSGASGAKLRRRHTRVGPRPSTRPRSLRAPGKSGRFERSLLVVFRLLMGLFTSRSGIECSP